MRQFLVDEIPTRQMGEVESYLKKKTVPSGLEKIYWLEIPQDLLSGLQWQHRECGPHYLAIETGKNFLKFEFLVRGRRRLHCDCVQYASQAQEAFLFDFAHQLIEALDLKG
jgi:hypothetical protein